MSEKVTIKTLWNLLDEVERGATDKSRTTDNVTDQQVKEIINKGAKIAIESRFTTGVSGAIGAGLAVGGAGATVGGAIGGGLVAGGTSVVTMSGITAASTAGLAGATAGGAAGSVVPIIGTAIGVIVGAGAGFFLYKKRANKMKNEKDRLFQEVLAKQNAEIKRLEKELAEIEKECNRTRQQNERYKYILGLIQTFQDISIAITAPIAAPIAA